MSIVLPKPGTYVVAVSGGVDSMALLHLLHTQNNGNWKLTVAHLDHGIRPDSHEDRRFVQQTVQNYGLPFVYHQAELGSEASEAVARKARYDFLRSVQNSTGAVAIITAHHQDDVLETAIINLLRGSGRKGLTALKNRDGIERPLLTIPKSMLVSHAQAKGLQWREDSTNKDMVYTRNYVRHKLLNRFDDHSRATLAQLITDLEVTNKHIDSELNKQFVKHMLHGRLDRRWFISLPHIVAREVMASWLRMEGLRNFDRPTLERLVVAGKIGYPGTRYDVYNGAVMTVWIDNLALATHER